MAVSDFVCFLSGFGLRKQFTCKQLHAARGSKILQLRMQPCRRQPVLQLSWSGIGRSSNSGNEKCSVILQGECCIFVLEEEAGCSGQPLCRA